MSNPPPVNGPDRRSGPQLDTTDARGAIRTGRNIWILIISLALAVVLLLGYVLIHAPHMNSLNKTGQDLNRRDVNSFSTPEPSPRQAPAGEPSTTSANGTS